MWLQKVNLEATARLTLSVSAVWKPAQQLVMLLSGRMWLSGNPQQRPMVHGRHEEIIHWVKHMNAGMIKRKCS